MGAMQESVSGAVSVQVKYGTGSAPANGAAATGTNAGGPNSSFPSASGSAGSTIPYVVGGIITGLTLGTAYWFDVALTNISGAGPASTVNQSFMAVEL
jgi:hypothetical protein